jgi:hypothetical protein
VGAKARANNDEKREFHPVMGQQFRCFARPTMHYCNEKKNQFETKNNRTENVWCGARKSIFVTGTRRPKARRVKSRTQK